MAPVNGDCREFAELFPAVFLHFCRRFAPGEYRPSHEASAILEHLANTGPLTVSEAARHFGRSQAATSELIDRLRTRGLLDRIRDERDGRRHLVWLTEKGLALWRTQREVLDPERLEAAFEKLTPQERQELVRGMRALLREAPVPRKKRKEQE